MARGDHCGQDRPARHSQGAQRMGMRKTALPRSLRRSPLSSSRANLRMHRMPSPRISMCCRGPGSQISMLSSKMRHSSCVASRYLTLQDYRVLTARKKLSETCDAKTHEWDVREKTRNEDCEQRMLKLLRDDVSGFDVLSWFMPRSQTSEVSCPNNHKPSSKACRRG